MSPNMNEYSLQVLEVCSHNHPIKNDVSVSVHGLPNNCGSLAILSLLDPRNHGAFLFIILIVAIMVPT